MRVTATLTAWEGAAASPVGSARARVSSRRGLLLTLRDGDGRAGQGEATPLPGYSREGFDEVRAALSDVASRLGDGALDAPFEALAGAGVASLPGAARFAAETALLDLCARRRAVPLHALLRGDAAASPVAVSAYAGAALDEGLVDAARAALARGVTTVKVKLSGVAALFAREVSALSSLRASAPGAWRLRLDLNGAWSRAEATASRFEALAGLGVDFVEQPVAPGSLGALGPQAVPWAIDESLDDAGDLAAVLAAGRACGCAAAVVKPAVHGLLGARSLCAQAHAAGLGVVVTHLFDGPVALAAACELALSLEAPWPCGLDAHPGLAAWPTVALPQREAGAWVTPSARAGHGVALELPRG